MGRANVLAATVLGAVCLWHLSSKVTLSSTDAEIPECVTGRQTVTVRGRSMRAMLPEGARLVLLRGFYACRAPARGELIALHRAGSAVPLLRVVQAIPGDTLSVETSPGGSFLLLNGERAKNSKGEHFPLDGRSWRKLTHYAERYGGRIPARTFLVFGELAGHAPEDREFGLVSQGELIGRLTPLPPPTPTSP